jgi:hypothetical protein
VIAGMAAIAMQNDPDVVVSNASRNGYEAPSVESAVLRSIFAGLEME